MNSELTTRILASAEPGESEERFRTLFESAPIGIAVHSADGRLVETNQAYQRMLGYSALELRELGVKRVTHPEDVAEGRRLFDELRAGTREHYQRAKRLLHKDGRVLWGQSTASAIRDASGRLRYIISVVEDTTERRKAEKRQRAFYELGHRLSAAATEETAGRVILGIADQLFGWDACYLHLYDEKGQLLTVLTIDTIGGQRTELPPSTLALDPSPMMRRVSADGPLLILREHPDEAADDLVAFGQKDRRSAALMYAPIHQGDKTMGVLSVQSYTPHAYDREDLDTLQSLADHCGAALDRIRSRSQLHREEASHRALLQAMPDSMFRVRADGTLLDSKAATEDSAVQVLHRSRGLRLEEVWPAPLATQTMACVERALRTGMPQRFEFQPDTPETFRQYEARVVRSGDDEVLIIIRDCSEQVRLQREVLNISIQERQRIGKDLHDDLCQLLTGLGYLAQSLQTRLAPTMKASGPPRDPDPSAASTAGHIVELANQALSWTRKLSHELASEGLEIGGLFPALTDLTGTLGPLFRISCSVRWDAGIQFSDRILEEHLYRITQEAITNAVRHGKAGRITVDFAKQTSMIVLTIQDDGVGLAEAAGSTNAGMGLRIMRYRARQIGADFNIEALPEGGTAVMCRIPSTSLASGTKTTTPLDSRVSPDSPEEEGAGPFSSNSPEPCSIRREPDHFNPPGDQIRLTPDATVSGITERMVSGDSHTDSPPTRASRGEGADLRSRPGLAQRQNPRAPAAAKEKTRHDQSKIRKTVQAKGENIPA